MYNINNNKFAKITIYINEDRSIIYYVSKTENISKETIYSILNDYIDKDEFVSKPCIDAILLYLKDTVTSILNSFIIKSEIIINKY